MKTSVVGQNLPESIFLGSKSYFLSKSSGFGSRSDAKNFCLHANFFKRSIHGFFKRQVLYRYLWKRMYRHFEYRVPGNIIIKLLLMGLFLLGLRSSSRPGTQGFGFRSDKSSRSLRIRIYNTVKNFNVFQSFFKTIFII
jgi:hypothetical protein